MTEEQIKKAISIKDDIQEIEKAIIMFTPGKHTFCGEADRQTALEKIKKGAKCILRLKKGQRLSLNAPGFFGGADIYVDKEFVDHSREYFERKLEEKRKELDAL